MGDSTSATDNLKRLPSSKSKQSQLRLGSRSQSRVKFRKSSYGFGDVPGIRPIERAAQLGPEFRRPMLLFLPTYQLEPSVPFNVPQVEVATNKVLDELFTDHKYNVQETPALALRIAGDLMRQVKAMNFNRYRIITVCSISQKRAQSCSNCISFLWDHERDGYVDAQRENNTVFLQVTTFGVYLD